MEEEELVVEPPPEELVVEPPEELVTEVPESEELPLLAVSSGEEGVLTEDRLVTYT